MYKYITAPLSRFALLCLLLSPSAWALSLDEAKAGGLVGETPSGYLASVSPSANAETTKLVATINQKRKVAYAQAAQKAGVQIEVIEARVGQKLFEKADKGNYLQNPDGRWYQK